jgi:hypothetical protein
MTSELMMKILLSTALLVVESQLDNRLFTVYRNFRSLSIKFTIEKNSYHRFHYCV